MRALGAGLTPRRGRRTTFRRLRALASFLATLGASVGVARTALPPHGHFSRARVAIGATVDAGSATADDSAPRVNEARVPRGGMRRVAPTTGPSFRDDQRAFESRDANRASSWDRDVLVPPSFVPPPPFHPPRSR
ncbi:MAG TPA: hypothetical protein VGQ44_13440 [Gemmatimonadaceae bacterium]|nr:hypothetical protein [Gemmatimonadaceae bacterium]